MQFSDMLIFLMNVTHVSNRDLAHAMSVDPSLISLFRTGRRARPRNPEHVYRMALFFAQHCEAEYQRHAIAEMLGYSAISTAMPVEELANCLYRWLMNDQDIVDRVISGINFQPAAAPRGSVGHEMADVPERTAFYYGDKGRREAARHMMRLIQSVEEPCSILVSSDANLDWLMEDYRFAGEMQDWLADVLNRGFSIHQIMPSVNYLNSYVESLRYWLPIYISGRAKVFYYPRLRDTLFRQSAILLPGHCVQACSGVGMHNRNYYSLVSADPRLVDAYTVQYEDYLSLCLPAIVTHTDEAEFPACIMDIYSRGGVTLQKVAPLSLNSMPKSLLEYLCREEKEPGVNAVFQAYLEGVPRMEERLSDGTYIDMSYLHTAEEVRSGRVPMLTPRMHRPEQLCYTPETYVMHLKNILRLMDTYENYHFIPYRNELNHDFNFIVNEDSEALMIRGAESPLMLEFRRPEMIWAFREHLYREADRIGYLGIRRDQIRMQLKALIRELQG